MLHGYRQLYSLHKNGRRKIMTEASKFSPKANSYITDDQDEN